MLRLITISTTTNQNKYSFLPRKISDLNSISNSNTNTATIACSHPAFLPQTC